MARALHVPLWSGLAAPSIELEDLTIGAARDAFIRANLPVDSPQWHDGCDSDVACVRHCPCGDRWHCCHELRQFADGYGSESHVHGPDRDLESDLACDHEADVAGFRIQWILGRNSRQIRRCNFDSWMGRKAFPQRLPGY